MESPAGTMETDDGSGQANAAQKSDEEIAQKFSPGYKCADTSHFLPFK